MSRRIAITGVSRGLGRAMVEQFIERGHTIYGCARNSDAIEELRNEFPSHHFDVVDISHSDAVEKWANGVIADVVPDLLINNAAVINRSEPLWEVHAREFESLMNVNVCGTFHTIKHFMPAMIAAGTGVIVNFSSGWGRSTSPEVVPYCASKFAIEGLSKGCRRGFRRKSREGWRWSLLIRESSILICSTAALAEVLRRFRRPVNGLRKPCLTC